MTKRFCGLSDLVLAIDVIPDVAIADDGTPDSRSLAAVAERLATDWRDPDFQWYYICNNCWKTALDIDRVWQVGEKSAKAVFEIVHGFEPQEAESDSARDSTPAERRLADTAGRPHRGFVSQKEQVYVRAHLDEVNARLAAEGLRQIDPRDPKHAKRYGFTDTANDALAG